MAVRISSGTRRIMTLGITYDIVVKADRKASDTQARPEISSPRLWSRFLAFTGNYRDTLLLIDYYIIDFYSDDDITGWIFAA